MDQVRSRARSRTWCESKQTVKFREEKRYRKKQHKARRTLYLSVVRPVLAYASQVWSPQSIGLIKRTERIQRRASKFILNLPYMCSESFRERLITLELMPLSYRHEYMDLMFFFKVINGLVVISEDVFSITG